jgi:hypothetical protein
MTSRALHRRLVESGTTFRKLEDELLRGRAESLLRDMDISLVLAGGMRLNRSG